MTPGEMTAGATRPQPAPPARTASTDSRTQSRYRHGLSRPHRLDLLVAQHQRVARQLPVHLAEVGLQHDGAERFALERDRPRQRDGGRVAMLDGQPVPFSLVERGKG